jgi:hypothetical protein
MSDGDRFCANCGALRDDRRTHDDSGLTEKFLQLADSGADGSVVEEHIKRLPVDRVEQLSFKLLQIAMSMYAHAITERVRSQRPVPEPKTTARPSLGSEKIHAGAEDRLVAIQEAARLLGFSRSWLYQNHAKLPFTRRQPNGRLRFSYKGMMEYMNDSNFLQQPALEKSTTIKGR